MGVMPYRSLHARRGGDAMYRGRCMECGGQKLLPPHLPILGGVRGVGTRMPGCQGEWQR